MTELSSRWCFSQCCHGRGHNPIPKMNHESPPKWKDLGVVFVHMFQVFFFWGGGNIFNRCIFSAKWFNYQLNPCSLNRLACGIVSIDKPVLIDIDIYIYTYIFAIYTYKTQILKASEIAHDEHTLCNLKQQTPFFSADFKRTWWPGYTTILEDLWLGYRSSKEIWVTRTLNVCT